MQKYRLFLRNAINNTSFKAACHSDDVLAAKHRNLPWLAFPGRSAEEPFHFDAATGFVMVSRSTAAASVVGLRSMAVFVC